VPKGRAIDLSGFYGKPESSNCYDDDDGWGLSSLDSERLVAEFGDQTQSLSVLEEMV
jgi:hypothetical protein